MRTYTILEDIVGRSVTATLLLSDCFEFRDGTILTTCYFWTGSESWSSPRQTRTYWDVLFIRHFCWQKYVAVTKKEVWVQDANLKWYVRKRQHTIDLPAQVQDLYVYYTDCTLKTNMEPWNCNFRSVQVMTPTTILNVWRQQSYLYQGLGCAWLRMVQVISGYFDSAHRGLQRQQQEGHLMGPWRIMGWGRQVVGRGCPFLLAVCNIPTSRGWTLELVSVHGFQIFGWELWGKTLNPTVVIVFPIEIAINWGYTGIPHFQSHPNMILLVKYPLICNISQCYTTG